MGSAEWARPSPLTGVYPTQEVTEMNQAEAPTRSVATADPVAPAAAEPYSPATPVAANSARPAVAGAPVYTNRVAVYPIGARLFQLVWLAAGVVNLIVALDFVFRAVAAHNTGFAHYIYRLGGWLAAPFDGIFNTTVAFHGTAVLRWADVLAVVVYTAAAWIVTKLVRIVASPRTRVTTV
jgi:hypothetical protein